MSLSLVACCQTWGSKNKDSQAGRKALGALLESDLILGTFKKSIVSVSFEQERKTNIRY